MNITQKTKSIIIGVIMSLIVAGVLIFAIETDKSLLQIFITAALLTIPIMFISSINGKVLVFIFSFIFILGGYLCYKMEWYDTIYGLIIAATLGGAAHYFKISKTTTFSAESYKEKQKTERFDTLSYKEEQKKIREEING